MSTLTDLDPTAYAELVQKMCNLAQYRDMPYAPCVSAAHVHVEPGDIAIIEHRGAKRWAVVRDVTATDITVTYMTATGLTKAARDYAAMLDQATLTNDAAEAEQTHGLDSEQYRLAQRRLAVRRLVRGAYGAPYAPITTCTVPRLGARIAH